MYSISYDLEQNMTSGDWIVLDALMGTGTVAAAVAILLVWNPLYAVPWGLGAITLEEMASDYLYSSFSAPGKRAVTESVKITEFLFYTYLDGVVQNWEPSKIGNRYLVSNSDFISNKSYNDDLYSLNNIYIATFSNDSKVTLNSDGTNTKKLHAKNEIIIDENEFETADGAEIKFYSGEW